MSVVVIKRLSDDVGIYDDFPVIGEPGWWKVQDRSGMQRKPLIRCTCGSVSGIGLHHVHADGRVTNSYYHKKGTVYPEDPNGCEWHVWLQLADWDGGDIPPG